MGSSHPAGFVAVRKGAFQQFPALLAELLAMMAFRPASIGGDGLLLLGFTFPFAPPTLRFWYVTPHLDVLQRHHRFAAVVSLVSHYLRDSVGMNLRFGFRLFYTSRSINSATASPASA